MTRVVAWHLRELPDRARLDTIPPLVPGDVHVWHVAVPAPPGAMLALHALLDADEAARAARFHRAIDRDRYTVTRGILRALLSRYLGIEPATLTFTYGEFGKPQSDAARRGDGVAFNVSHSGDKALVAFGRVAAVGVDVEAHRSDVDVLDLSRMVFADEERNVLAAAPSEQRRALFYRTWARKEAVLKGCGTGLSSEPKRVVVLDGRDTADDLIAVDAGARFGAWGVVDVDAGADYSAAIAAPGTNWRPRHFELAWNAD